MCAFIHSLFYGLVRALPISCLWADKGYGEGDRFGYPFKEPADFSICYQIYVIVIDFTSNVIEIILKLIRLY